MNKFKDVPTEFDVEFFEPVRDNTQMEDNNYVVVVKSNFEDEDEFQTEIDMQEEFDGHLLKNYVSVNDGRGKKTFNKSPRSSKFFKELFNAAKSKSYHYVTYLDDCIHPQDGSQQVFPQYVQCLLKELPSCSPTEALYCETVGSRFANAMGVDTVFNLPYARQPEDDEYYESDYPDYDGILSVDYVKSGYRTMSLAEMYPGYYDFETMEDVLKVFESAIYSYSLENKIPNFEENFQALKRDFAKQFFFRSIICEDYDVSPKNLSVLINEADGSLSLAPCHDMELFFVGSRVRSAFFKDMAVAIDYLKNEMPDILQELLSNFKRIMTTGEFERIFEETVNVHPYIFEGHVQKMRERFDDIMLYCKETNMEL